MKRASTVEKQRRRRHPAAARRLAARSGRTRWYTVLQCDGGDAGYRDVADRIARGERIRGHAL